jgi:hypothetical protein
MAKASGILASVSTGLEVPHCSNSCHGDSTKIETGAHEERPMRLGLPSNHRRTPVGALPGELRLPAPSPAPISCKSDGTSVRRTLLNPAFVLLTHPAAASICAPNGASAFEAPFVKVGGHEEATQQACEETEQNEVEPNGVKSERRIAGCDSEGGIRPLNRENSGGSKNAVGKVGVDEAKTVSPSPSTETKKLFLEFISLYLGVEVFGVQPGFRSIPSQ